MNTKIKIEALRKRIINWMSFSLNFYLATVAVAIGIATGGFFFVQWHRHHHTSPFLLFWAIGFFCLYIFEIPTILSDARLDIVLTNFDHFFAITVSLMFLGLTLFYLGLRSLLGPIKKRVFVLFAIWFTAAVVYLVYFFWESTGFTSRLPLYGMIVLFILPLHIMCLIVAFRLWGRHSAQTFRFYRTGIIMLILAFICAFGRNAVLLHGFTVYPPAFWFLVLQSPWFFWLEISGTLFIVTGFLFIHRQHMNGQAALTVPSPSISQ